MMTDDELMAFFSKEEEAKEPIVEIKNNDPEDVKKQKENDKRIRKQDIRNIAIKELNDLKKTRPLATTNPGRFIIMRDEDTETVDEFLGKYFKPDTIETVKGILTRFIST